MGNDHARTTMSLTIKEKILLKDKIKQMKGDIATGKDEMKAPEEARYGKLCASEDSLDKVIKTLEIVIRNCGQIEVTFSNSSGVGNVVVKLSSDFVNIISGVLKNYCPQRRVKN